MNPWSRFAIRSASGVAVVAGIGCGGSPTPATSPSGASGGAQAAHVVADVKASIANMSPAERQAAYDAELAALKSRDGQLAAYLDGFPKELTDVDALAATFKTPQAAFEFVRDRIALEPYPGVMKGAQGTLLTRGGNDLDRALLLSALLKHQGVTSTIAHGQLSPDDARRILSQIAGAPDSVDQILHSLPKGPAVADPNTQALFERVASQRQTGMKNDLDQTFQLLSSSLKAGGVSLGKDATAKRIEVLQDHHWIEANEGGKTVAYDASLASAQRGQRLVAAADTLDPGNLPGDIFQRLTIRVVTDSLRSGDLSTTEVLKKEVRAADVLGKTIRFALEPDSSTRPANQFLPVLEIDADETSGQTFALHGAAAAPPQSQPTPSPMGGFGGLGGALGGGGAPPPPPPPAAGAPAAGAVLGRVFVEITTRAPHLADVADRRVLMDRLDDGGGKPRLLPALADDASVRPLVFAVWDAAISVGSFHPLYVLRQQAATLAAQEHLEEKTLARVYLGQGVQQSDAPASVQSSDLVSFFWSSDVARHKLRVNGAQHTRSYYERPRIALMRHGYAISDWSSPSKRAHFLDGIDLVNQPFAFVGPTDEAATLAMKAGIADTSLERGRATGTPSYNTLRAFAAARGQSVSFVTLKSGDVQAVAKVAAPAPIRGVMREDLARGNALLALPGFVSVGGQPQFGWWSVDPATGYAIGRMDLGGAQGMAEDAKLVKATASWDKTYVGLIGDLQKCAMSAESGALGGEPTPGDELADCYADAACDALKDVVEEEAEGFAELFEKEEEEKNLKQMILGFMQKQATGAVSAKAGGGAQAACQAAAGGGGE